MKKEIEISDTARDTPQEEGTNSLVTPYDLLPDDLWLVHVFLYLDTLTLFSVSGVTKNLHSLVTTLPLYSPLPNNTKRTLLTWNLLSSQEGNFWRDKVIQETLNCYIEKETDIISWCLAATKLLLIDGIDSTKKDEIKKLAPINFHLLFKSELWLAITLLKKLGKGKKFDDMFNKFHIFSSSYQFPTGFSDLPKVALEINVFGFKKVFEKYLGFVKKWGSE